MSWPPTIPCGRFFPATAAAISAATTSLTFALNRVPPRYVSSREGAVVTEVSLEKEQSRAAIEVVVMEALRKISVAPRCGRTGGVAPA